MNYIDEELAAKSHSIRRRKMANKIDTKTATKAALFANQQLDMVVSGVWLATFLAAYETEIHAQENGRQFLPSLPEKSNG